MKKRILAALCAAALALGLLVTAASAAGDVYFLALNDNLQLLTADLMPIRIYNGVYVPSGVFDRRLTGMNLGVFYGQDKTLGTATLYSKDKTLIFDINAGYASDSPGGSNYSYRAVVLNGRTYFPAYAVCRFFGLQYSALSTDYGPLIRIKMEQKKDWWLTDSVFVASAALQMSSRLNEYLQSQASPGASAAPPVSPSVSPTPAGGDKSHVRVYLAMRVDSGARLGELLDILAAQAAPVLLFFRPSELAEYDDFIRRAAGSGSQIGLLLEGETVAELETQFAQGNRLLEHILRQRTYTVLVDGPDSQRSELNEQGYLCWLENVDGRVYSRGSNALVTAILDGVDAKRTFARVLLEDGIAPSALSRLVQQLRQEQYDLRPAVETEF